MIIQLYPILLVYLFLIGCCNDRKYVWAVFCLFRITADNDFYTKLKLLFLRRSMLEITLPLYFLNDIYS